LTGILLTFLTAGLVGIVFVFVVLPIMAHKMTHAIYDSAEMIERDVMHDARALVAQGEYEAAIEAFKEAAKADPLNRLPWVEIAKIYKDNLENPQAAIDTIREALDGQEWQVNDAAYFMFRLAELHDQELGERETAVAIMRQVVDQFPQTRHSANAKTKLHDWGYDEPQAMQPQVAAIKPPPPGKIRRESPGEPGGPDNRG
jgi:tetratricopeptide (TPR) repeat protein